MRTGDIVLIPFPFTEYSNVKVRPATVVCETKDGYKDLVLCAVSSTLKLPLTPNEMMLIPDTENQLRTSSTLKVDRIFTAKKEHTIANIGKLNSDDLAQFKEIFRPLID
jgi:mRNA interferase MazF